MKILHINASYKPAYIYGGPTMSISKLCEVLVKHGINIQVFTTTANGPDELNVLTNRSVMVDGVPVRYFKRITKDHSHISPALLKAVWQSCKQFDIVHIHAWWNMVSVLSCLLSIIRGVPVILSPRGTLSNYSFHNKNSFLKNCIHFFLGKPLLKRSFIHATSGHEEKALGLLTTPKRFFILPNFIDLPAIAVINNNPVSNTLKLLFLSRIEEKKGLDILITALKNITIPYSLTIAGGGNHNYIDSLKLLADTHGVAENISWIGFQGDDKFAIFVQHDVLILPSHDENFGNVVIESLYAGTGVLISEHVGLANYVSSHQLGWICSTNPLSIAETINNIKPEMLATIKQRAGEIIRGDFDENNLVRKYISMYDQIVTN